MTVSKRQAKEFWAAWASGKPPEFKTAQVRPWMAPTTSPPTIKTPAFMLGGRFAVIREPQFMREARPDAPASRADSAKSPGRSAVDPSDESSNGT